MSYVNLINYTNYSLGVLSIEEIIGTKEAKEQKIAAISDYQTLSGVPEFYEKCVKNNIKPIIGVTLKLEHNKNSGNIILYSKNQEGYNNLLKLVDISKGKGYININDIKDRNEGCICLLGQKSSIISTLYNNEKKEEIDIILETIKPYFEKNILLGLHVPAEKEKNSYINTLSKKFDIPIIVVNNNRAINKHHYPLVEEKIKNHYLYNNEEIIEQEIGPNDYYKNEKYYLDKGVNESLINRNLKIANIIKDINVFNPIEIVKTKETRELSKIVFDCFTKYCVDNNIEGQEVEDLRDKINYELSVIEKTGFEQYFKVLYDLKEFCLNENIAYGIRGSAAGSLVVHILGMSHINPTKHNLLFERFLNEERKELPDIDFEVGEPEKIIEYIQGVYGQDNVASVMSYNGLRKGEKSLEFAKNALLSTLKEEKSKNKLNELYQHIIENSRIKNKNGYQENLLDEPISELLENNKAFYLIRLYKTNKQARYLIDLALKSEGIYYNIAKRKSSFVISDKPINQYLSCIKEDGTNYLECDKEYIQKLGLVKYDFLASKILDKTLKMYQSIDNQISLYKEANYDNEEVYQLISSGYTTGLNQIKKIGNKLCTEIKPKEFKDLIAIMALVRLNKDNINEYTKAKKDIESNNQYIIDNENKYSEIYNQITNETYGIILYEEQIMLLAQNIGGLSRYESDDIRGAIKKNKKDDLLFYKEKFLKNAQQKVNKEQANNVFNLLEERCGKYHFNKSHAAIYASICYKQAWAKTYMPAEFYNYFGDNTVYKENKENKKPLLEEIKNRGYKFLKPDINRVEEQKRTVTVHYKEKDYDCIDIGFNDFIDQKLSQTIIQDREENGSFENIFNFIERVYPKIIGAENILDPKVLQTEVSDTVKENIKNMIKYGFFDNQHNIQSEQVEEFRSSLVENIDIIFESALKPFSSENISIDYKNNIIENIINEEIEKFGQSYTKTNRNKSIKNKAY